MEDKMDNSNINLNNKIEVEKIPAVKNENNFNGNSFEITEKISGINIKKRKNEKDNEKISNKAKNEIICKHCGSLEVVKKGKRKLAKNVRQVYYCKNCDSRFSLGLNKKRFDAWIIVKAVCYYNSGYSYEETSEILSRKYKVKIGKSSVERFVKEFSLGYLDIRDKIIGKHGRNLIVEKMYKHSGLVYNFKLHKGKLKEYGKFDGLRNFIFNVSKGINNEIFNNVNSRCSDQKDNGISVDVLCVENSRFNKVVGEMLKIVKSNKQRHSVVENILLYSDRDTIAIELPVWYWDKYKDNGVCGHIDVVQVKYGKVWILDYKPDAEKENFDSVVSQLYNYALALHFRSGVLLEDMKCGWFDSVKTYCFEPSEVVIR